MNMECKRDAIIEMAEQQMGVTEFPAGSNKVKFNEWYYPEGHPYFIDSRPYAWCGTFCSYVYYFAGFPMPAIDSILGVHYVPTLYSKAKALKWATNEPKRGDLVLFDFMNDGKTFAQHIGIFEKWIGHDLFTCIEGNTSSNERGSQDNGGGVFKRTRNKRHVVLFVNLIDNVK